MQALETLQRLHGLQAYCTAHGLHGLQGLQAFFTAQGLQGLQAFFTAQGLQGLQAFFTAHGLHGLHALAAAHGLHGVHAASKSVCPWVNVFDAAQGFVPLTAVTMVGAVTATIPPRIAALSGLRPTWSLLRDCFISSSSIAQINRQMRQAP